jgi:hypothetical protein
MKQHTVVDRTFDKTFNSMFGTTKKVRFTLRGLPATVDVDSNGNWLTKPVIDNESHIMSEIVEPFAKGLTNITSDTPQNLSYIIEFPGKNSQLDENQTTEVTSGSHKGDDGNRQSIEYTVDEPRYGLSRVILPRTTRDDIEITLNLVKQHDLMYDKWNLKSICGSGSQAVTINFYGPSGTGKTLCAEAIAFELNKGILRVKYPELESSLVGQTNKNISEIFRIGREKDCVIFFDEADSILGKRLSSVIQGADHAINMSRSVMLIELERFNGVIVFATNFIKNYDTAFERRLLHFVKFDLPDIESREKIFGIHLPKELPIDWSDSSVTKLAELTEGFNGGDIRNVVMKSAAKAASQNFPNEEKIVKFDYLLESIEEVRQAKNLIGCHREER